MRRVQVVRAALDQRQLDARDRLVRALAGDLERDDRVGVATVATPFPGPVVASDE